MELYIHIPFCKKKCRYCAFVSFPGQEAFISDYIDLLLQEAKSRSAESNGQVITSVYIGGGTPSLLSPAQLSALISGLRSVYDFSRITEFTIEANPGTVTREWLDTSIFLGINRLSFGMQAYQDHLLQLLGRIHSFSQVETSVALARAAGFTNISLDLIFGIPGQTINDWNQTTDAALSLEPEHISAYGLIPEEGTLLYMDLQNGSLVLPDPEEEREMYNLIISKNKASGFHQYEISNFARNNHECRHNIGYWTQVPYIGLGVSAASMTGIIHEEDGLSYSRSVNPLSLEEYAGMVRRGMYAEKERISPPEARFETMMLGLRMNRGVSETEFIRQHRCSVEQCYGPKMEEMKRKGLLIHENGFWKLSARGFDIQNSILVELMD